MSVAFSKLSNGLTIATHHMPHLETASLGIWVKAGARHEMPAQNGVSHFLEHMAFKGTTSRSAFDIVESIEDVGGDLNAATSIDQTAYYLRIMRSDVAHGIELLSDILLNPVFDNNEMERERAVIFQEYLASQDCPEDVVYELAQKQAFPNHALGRTILGTEESIMGLKVDDLHHYRSHHYGAHNLVLSAAGHVDHQAIVEQVESMFSTLQTDERRSPQRAEFHGGVIAHEKDFEQSHLVIGFEGRNCFEEDLFAAQILSMILGGGMSSRLFQEVRERRGLAYALYSYHSSWEDTGLFTIYAATGADKLDETLSLVLEQCEKILEHGVEEKELARAKAQLKSGLAMCLESSSSRAEQMARQALIWDKLFSVDYLIDKVTRVERQEIKRVAEKIFTTTQPVVSVAGAGRETQKYEYALKRLTQNVQQLEAV